MSSAGEQDGLKQFVEAARQHKSQHESQHEGQGEGQGEGQRESHHKGQREPDSEAPLSHVSDGFVWPADLVADLETLKALRDVPVGDFSFFPSELEYHEDGLAPEYPHFVFARNPTRSFLMREDGSLEEVHFAGTRPLPFSLREVLGMAAVFVDVQMDRVGDQSFLAPSAERAARDRMGSSFGSAADLLGLPLLGGIRAELEGRQRGAMLTMAVATALLLGSLLVALAIQNPAQQAIAVVLLGCVPLTIFALGMRAGRAAKRDLAELPTP